jgi:hypothetical protein
MLIIPGVNDTDIRIDHEWSGTGAGSRRTLTHIPTGLSVTREGDLQTPVHKIYEQLWEELKEKLKANGVIPDDSGND